MGLMSGKAEEVGCFGQCDVLGLGWMIWNVATPQRESRRLVQEEGMANDVQRHGNRA